LEFIDFRLQWEGRLNRSDLTEFFGISVPQASLDIALYQRLAPNNIAYDKQQKFYVSTEQFKPLLVPTDPLSFLNQVRLVEAHLLAKDATLLGWYPPVGIVRPPLRGISSTALRGTLKAIHEKRKLRIFYQSMTREESIWRDIGPHSIVFDGIRWHVRAYCFLRENFRDFVMARIFECELGTPTTIDGASDDCWNTLVELVLTTTPNLTASQRRAVELDYGMTDGHLTIETRKALLFYLLRQLPIATTGANTKHDHLRVENRDEIQKHLTDMSLDFTV
jgi:hypothetical protein